MKKADLKPYFDALAATFDKKIREGQGYQIFDQSNNTIDAFEGHPAEYLEELTGEELSEEMHDRLNQWGNFSELNYCIEGESAIQEQWVYSYGITGLVGTTVSFSILKLLDDHYITMNIDGAAYHFFRIEFNDKDEVDLSRFIVDYDTENRRQMINMDAHPVEMDTNYVNPKQLEKEFRVFINEYYPKPKFKNTITDKFIEMLRRYKKSYYEKFLTSDELKALEKELQKSVTEANPDILVDSFFKVIFANYR